MRIIENKEPNTLDENPEVTPKIEPKEEPKKAIKDPYKCFSDSLAEIAKDLYDLSFKLNKISGAILNFGEHEGNNKE